jgi:hypothetical protein
MSSVSAGEHDLLDVRSIISRFAVRPLSPARCPFGKLELATSKEKFSFGTGIKTTTAAMLLQLDPTLKETP